MSGSTGLNRSRFSGQIGSVINELALSLPLFALIIFSGLELLRYSFVAAKFDHVVYQSSRAAALGWTVQNGGVSDPVIALRDLISARSGLSVSSFKICSGHTANCSVSARGAENEWMTMEATSSIPIIFGAISMPVQSVTIVRNEPRFKVGTTLGGIFQGNVGG